MKPGELSRDATSANAGAALGNQPAYGMHTLELSIMNYMGSVGAALVSGFSVYRYQTGDTVGAMINAFIVTMVVIAMLLGRERRFAHYALILFGLVITVASLMSALLVSSNGLLWAYLVIWVNCLILPRLLTVLVNALIILALAVTSRLFESPLHHISWITVAMLMAVFGLIFTNQLRQQRRLLAAQATLDPLTGVGNRRLMQQHLEATVAERRRTSDLSSTIMVIDLDLFKRINDNHGHDAGDQVLADFAARVRDTLRAEDGLYRMGGEEFVVLLRGMPADAAELALPELHQRLSGSVQGPDGPVRFSAGAAVLKRGEDWSKWLARADDALYAAKAAGRDRLVIVPSYESVA
ncbi:MAG TPA: GGDEF domain-containing protein [Kineobactrum sp.]